MLASSEDDESALELAFSWLSLNAEFSWGDAGRERRVVGQRAALAEDSSCSSLAAESSMCSVSVLSTFGVNALRANMRMTKRMT